jgi:hypothetical protein
MSFRIPSAYNFDVDVHDRNFYECLADEKFSANKTLNLIYVFVLFACSRLADYAKHKR